MILLYVTWLIFHGRITWDVLLTGGVVCGSIGFLLTRMKLYKFSTELTVLKVLPHAVIYLILLFWDVVKANFHMIYLVLIKHEVEPSLVYFKSPVSTKTGTVAVANSITLTPGTLTVDIKDDEFCVHVIDKPSKEGLRNLWTVKHIQEMEGNA